MHHLLYHANCADGFSAACIARHALLALRIPESEFQFIAVNYGDPVQSPASVQIGDTVTYLDYTPPAGVIPALLEQGCELTIIDHHEKAAPLHSFTRHPDGSHTLTEPPSAWESVFSLHYSGAALAWHYYYPGKPMPHAVELIQWRDLGHAFQKPEEMDSALALDLHAALFRALPRTFDAWTPLLLGQCGLLPFITLGSRLRRADDSIIRAAIQNCHWLDFSAVPGLSALCPTPSALARIPAVNGLDAGMISDACTRLLEAYPSAPFAVSWFVNHRTGQLVYSLRSRKQDHPAGHVNVSDLAAACAPGGGGHPCAAGFSTLTAIPFAAS